MALEASMEAGGGRERIRAADADRDHVAEILGAAYGEGRLARDEYDTRLAAAFSARTYGDLDQLTADLPAPARPEAPVPAAGPAMAVPEGKPNGLAVASLICGVAQFFVGPLGTIPAIVFGHMARNQIRRTGEQGAGLALLGLLLGWGAVLLGVVFLAVSLALTARVGTPMPGPMMP